MTTKPEASATAQGAPVNKLIPCELHFPGSLSEACVLGPKVHGAQIVIYSGSLHHSEFVARALNSHADLMACLEAFLHVESEFARLGQPRVTDLWMERARAAISKATEGRV